MIVNIFNSVVVWLLGPVCLSLKVKQSTKGPVCLQLHGELMYKLVLQLKREWR